MPEYKTIHLNLLLQEMHKIVAQVKISGLDDASREAFDIVGTTSPHIISERFNQAVEKFAILGESLATASRVGDLKKAYVGAQLLRTVNAAREILEWVPDEGAPTKGERTQDKETKRVKTKMKEVKEEKGDDTKTTKRRRNQKEVENMVEDKKAKRKKIESDMEQLKKTAITEKNSENTEENILISEMAVLSLSIRNSNEIDTNYEGPKQTTQATVKEV